MSLNFLMDGLLRMEEFFLLAILHFFGTHFSIWGRFFIFFFGNPLSHLEIIDENQIFRTKVSSADFSKKIEKSNSKLISRFFDKLFVRYFFSPPGKRAV